MSPQAQQRRSRSWGQASKSDGGSHIGLMMVPTTAAEAWGWIHNVTAGASLFQTKLTTAATNANSIIATHPGLPNLTPAELENMALLLSGPYATQDLQDQYYIPVMVDGAWAWTVNTANNQNGVSYSNSCRADTQ